MNFMCGLFNIVTRFACSLNFVADLKCIHGSLCAFLVLFSPSRIQFIIGVLFLLTKQVLVV